ncbi:hypothetical protein BOX15_Mlig026630g4, partial [Macrostomum lignano]
IQQSTTCYYCIALGHLLINQSIMKAQQQQQQQPPNAQLQASVSPRIKIVLGEKPSVTHCNPFYLMSKEPPQEAPLTGASNLIKHHDLEQAYSMYCTRRLREELSCFLPGLPGQIDTNGFEDGSSLSEMIERPPVTGKDLAPLSANAMSAFRLHEGPVPPELAQLFNKPPPQQQQQQQPQPPTPQSSQQSQQPPGRTRKRRHEAVITDLIGSSHNESNPGDNTSASSNTIVASQSTSASSSVGVTSAQPVSAPSAAAHVSVASGAPAISRFAAGVPPLPPPQPLPSASSAAASVAAAASAASASSAMPTAAFSSSPAAAGQCLNSASAAAAAKFDKAERKAERKRKKEKKRKTKERT